jgi:hypothetical protein
VIDPQLVAMLRPHIKAAYDRGYADGVRTVVPSQFSEDAEGHEHAKDGKFAKKGGGGIARHLEGDRQQLTPDEDYKDTYRVGDHVVKHTTKGAAAREVAVSKIAKIAGVNAPESSVVEGLTGTPGKATHDAAVASTFVRDAKPLSSFDDAALSKELKKLPAGEIDKHVLFGFLIGDDDRDNGGNYLIGNNKLTQIDYSLAFKNKLGAWPITSSTLYPHVKDSPVNPKALADIAKRGSAMADELRASGHADWADGVEKRAEALKKLVQSAGGVRGLLGKSKPVSWEEVVQAADVSNSSSHFAEGTQHGKDGKFVAKGMKGVLAAHKTADDVNRGHLETALQSVTGASGFPGTAFPREHSVLQVGRRLASARRQHDKLGTPAEHTAALDEALRHIGATDGGESAGSVVPFDGAKHDSEGHISHGTPVRVKHAGYSLNDDDGLYRATKAVVEHAEKPKVFAEDAEGHEHAGKGKGGGQFVKKGGRGGVDDIEDAPKKANESTDAPTKRSDTSAHDYKENGTKAKAFKSWFGDWEKDPEKASKVVKADGSPQETNGVRDEVGKPLTVYHGTQAEFDAFIKSNNRSNGKCGPGFYFAESKDFAARYGPKKPDKTGGSSGKGSVKECYLNIRKPFSDKSTRLEDLPQSIQDPLKKEFKKIKGGVSYFQMLEAVGHDKGEYINNELQKHGFDGIRYTTIEHAVESQCWVAFEPNQVKAVDNEGTFNPGDPSMKFTGDSESDTFSEDADDGTECFAALAADADPEPSANLPKVPDLDVAAALLAALKAAGADDDADDLAELMADPERADELAELLSDEDDSEEVSTFASKHKDGDVWNTGKWHFKREGGKTRRISDPNRKSEPKKERSGPTPKERLIAGKAEREPARQAARDAYAKAKDAPHELTHADIPALAAHLDSLTRDELREHAAQAMTKLGGLKEDIVRRLVEKITGGATAGEKMHPDGTPEKPSTVKAYTLPVEALHVDPKRFQFKLNTSNPAGVTDEMKEVHEWNPDFAGVVSVWKDPADGKTYVVNGHHRRELAGRLGAKDMNVKYIEAKDAKEARSIGALVNIAEGRGTAVDAAKFMRDTGGTIDTLKKRGVSLKSGGLADQATTLTKLNDRAFERVAAGDLEVNKALAVAKHLSDPDRQEKLFKLLDKREDEGKQITDRTMEEMAKAMAASPSVTKTENTLWGPEETTEDVFVQRAELAGSVRAALSQELGNWAAVSSAKRAAKIGDAGNVLNVDENKKRAEAAEQGKNLYDTLVNRKGPISDALNEGAIKLANAKTKRERERARTETADAVRAAIQGEFDALERKPGEVHGGGLGPNNRPSEAASEPSGAGADEPERPVAEPAGLTPPSPGFTGIDANGHEWRDGEQVGKAEEPGTEKAPGAKAKEPHVDRGELPDVAKRAGVKNWKDAAKRGLTTVIASAPATAKGIAKAASNWINGSVDSAADYLAHEIIQQTAIHGSKELAYRSLAHNYDRRAEGATEPGQKERFQATAKGFRDAELAERHGAKATPAMEPTSPLPPGPWETDSITPAPVGKAPEIPEEVHRAAASAKKDAVKNGADKAEAAQAARDVAQGHLDGKADAKPTRTPPEHTPEQAHDLYQKSGTIQSGPKNSELNAAAKSILNMNGSQIKDLASKLGISSTVARAADKPAELARQFLDRRQRAIGVQILNAEGSTKERTAREEKFNRTLGDEPLLDPRKLASKPKAESAPATARPTAAQPEPRPEPPPLDVSTPEGKLRDLYNRSGQIIGKDGNPHPEGLKNSELNEAAKSIMAMSPKELKSAAEALGMSGMLKTAPGSHADKAAFLAKQFLYRRGQAAHVHITNAEGQNLSRSRSEAHNKTLGDEPLINPGA